ncbi:MAG: transglutaminase family protein [Pseudomonadales bacterium]|nr:transglutaminase family protein [Halioglobus sp.]MCP5123285.1 transglutaminase family protein [Pseudomonadales bacterium]MCP5192935.1 transglutaminase family protein [Pseudomonadales bacterium]
MTNFPRPEECLRPSRFIDSGHPAITALAGSLVDPAAGDVANAVALFYRVRDGIRYNPYLAGASPADYLASATLAAAEGWCVTKALVLAALCRAAGIPARVGYADVRNHLSTERLREAMQTDVFYFHGYTSLFLEGRWVKATPAFNIELCEKFGLRPLDFNGRQDSLYHAFNVAGNRHMEYLRERGEFIDLPYEDMMTVLREHYPRLITADGGPARTHGDSWEADVEREVAHTTR